MRSRRKKASLEMGIKAIVVVVLSMTLLGLGLTFINNMFRDITETTGQVSEQIRASILEDLRESDKKLSFPNSEVKLTQSSSKNLAIGVKNTGETDLEFSIEVSEIDENGNKAQGDDFGTFLYNKGVEELSVTESSVYPIKFTAKTVKDTRIFEITIKDRLQNKEYASKTFFITVQ